MARKEACTCALSGALQQKVTITVELGKMAICMGSLSFVLWIYHEVGRRKAAHVIHVAVWKTNALLGGLAILHSECGRGMPS